MKNLKYLKSLFTVATLVVTPILLQAQSITNGLVGWWPFTGNAIDSVDMLNNGTVYGATLTKDRFGNDSSAYYFDGNGDYINCGTHASIRSSTHSVNFWFRYTDTTQNSFVVNCHSGVSSGEWGSNCHHTSANGWQSSVSAGANNHDIGHKSLRRLSDDQWHMYTATYDKKTNIIAMYLDGCLSGYKNISGSSGGFNSNDSCTFRSGVPWVFGASSYYFTSSSSYGPKYYKGYLDDVRIYNRPLTSLDVKGLFIERTHFQDTTFTTIYDTSYVNIYDTTFVTTYDTVEVFDTTYILVYDTTFINDTIAVYDTISAYDTTFTTVFDTTIITIYDTTYISVTDTLYINVKWSSTGTNYNRAKVYPNPTNEKITIDFGDYLKIYGHKVAINNSVGQQVYSSDVTSRLMDIDINSLGSAGTYLLIISDKNLNILSTKKIIMR